MSDLDDEMDKLAKNIAKEMRGSDVALVNKLKAMDTLTRYASFKKKNAGKTAGNTVSFDKFRQAMQDVKQKGKQNG